MHPASKLSHWIIVLALLLFPSGVVQSESKANALEPACDRPGWFPTDFGLKDHHVFWYDGYYYLVSITARNETRFVYGRSADLCNWEELTPILSTRTPGAWDELVIWAPFVYEEDGVYYLYYAGATYQFTQSIMLATSTDPADPESWEPQGMIFQPSHEGSIWTSDQGGDCRDPSVIKVGDTYYLYYTARDLSGGIVGLATASSPSGPWMDWGAVAPPVSQGILESSTITRYEKAYYLFYHHTGNGEQYRIGASPAGPWQAPLPLSPGWAHEVWQSPDGEWFTSYLTDYTVTISPLLWDDHYGTPRPWIGSSIYRLSLPLTLQQGVARKSFLLLKDRESVREWPCSDAWHLC